MKLLSLFSGIGAFEKALENLKIDYELVGFSEIDKWAIESYSAVHNVDTSLNLGDISKIKNEDLPNNVDMVTYGFPCQDISVAGNQKGINENTRSGLLYEAERVIQKTKPKFAIAENVKNLVGKRFKDDFEKLLERLDSYGYNNYWKVLNAKDFGIPQNRERVFIVSIRKDIDNGNFEFPEPKTLSCALKDFLDKQVEEKYNMTQEYSEYGSPRGNVISTMQGGYREPKIKAERVQKINKIRRYEVDVERLKTVLKRYKNQSMLTNKEIANKLNVKLTTVEHWFRSDDSFSIPSEDVWFDLKDLLQIETNEFDKPITTFEYQPNEYDMGNRVYNPKGIAPTITTSSDIEIKVGCDSGWQDNKVGINISPTLRANNHHTSVLDGQYVIRKLTPLECWRLMGFEDEDYWKARRRLEEVFYNGNDRSNSQMYKQAGNSIVVQVIEAIFSKLL